jgi:DNA-binding MarR family transcriptional regulator
MITVATKKKQEQDHIDRFLEQVAERLPQLDLSVEGIVDRISGLSRRFQRMMDETLEGFDLTFGEWQTLGSLHRKQKGGASPGELSKHAELSSGAMTNRLDRLEARGLVRRRPDPADRRGIRVELTAAGRRMYEETTSAQGAKEIFIASALTKREKEELNALLRKLMLAFEHGVPKRL